MTAITNENRDWSIINAADTALTGATWPALVVTGTLSPDATGNYDASGTYNSETAYTDGTYWIWKTGGVDAPWAISEAKGTADPAWLNGGAITDPYSVNINTTGTATATAGGAVFGEVTLATSEEQALECQFEGTTPKVVILYEGTEEVVGVEGERNCVVPLVLFIATKLDSGIDEAARITEMTRLMNAAKNAIEAGTHSEAIGFGDEDNYHPKGARWGKLDTAPSETNKQPWVAFRLPVSFGYGITSKTGH